MIQIQVDEVVVEQLYREAIEKKLKDFDKDLVFWDSKELRRRTCLSWGTIQDTFFFEEDFPKVKLGSKWLFPAKETQAFLEKWLLQKRERRK